MIGQHLGGQSRQNRMLGRRAVCLRLTLVRIFPGKPQPHGDAQIIRNGLDQYLRVRQKEGRDNGPDSNLINTVSV